MKRKILYSIGILTIILFCVLVVDYISYVHQQDAIVLEQGKKNSALLRTQVNEILQKTIEEAKTIVDSLHEYDYSKKGLERFIRNEAVRTNGILGITVGFERYGFDEKTKLYAPYFDKNKRTILRLEKLYNYTDPLLPAADWFTKVVKDEKASWIEPYYAVGAKALVADYGIPFFYTEGERAGQVRGTVTMTISLQGFKNLIHRLSLGKAGYGFVSSSKGAILAHPIEQFIGTKSVQELIAEETDPNLKGAYQALLNGKLGSLTYKDLTNKEDKLFFYDQVQASEWGIGVMFFKKDMVSIDKKLKRKYIHLAVVFGFLLFVLLAIYFTRDFLSNTDIWYLSFLSIAVLVSITVLIGYLQHSFPDKVADDEEFPMIALSDVKQFVSVQNEIEEEQNRKPWTEVPTGIFINELEFVDAYNVNVSGVVWQRFDATTLQNSTPGVSFPQISPFSEAQFLEERSRHTYGDKVLIHYNFRSTLHLPFDYSNYPFDKRNVSLKIEPINFEDKLLLTPDLGSYDYTTPSRKAGINKHIQLSGDKIQQSYFSYTNGGFFTDFGYPVKDFFTSLPVLQYNIKIRRVLLSSFVTYLIPIFVTLIMIFILIKATQKPVDLNNSEGGGIVQGMAAFFFVLVFSHIDLRKDILTGDLIYMEYFYFVSYAMIILATHNLITYTRRTHKLFDYRDNIIVKAIFWPTFLFLVLLITLFKFY